MNPTRNREVVGLIPGLTQWVKDPALLDPAPIGPLAWEPPYATGVALKKGQKVQKKKKERDRETRSFSLFAIQGHN